MKATTRKEHDAELKLSEIIVTPIAPAMSKEQASAMFAQESVLIGNSNVIPLYRVCELFGSWVRPWFEASRKPYDRGAIDGESAHMMAGVEWNSVGDVGKLSDVLYERGFRKVVSRNNAEIIIRREMESAYPLEG